MAFNNRGAGIDFDVRREINGRYDKAIVIGANNEIFEDCLIDIGAAIDFAKSKGYSEIVLMGHSYGCNKIVYYALEKGFTGDLILLAPCDIQDITNCAGDTWKAKRVGNFDLFKYRNGELVPALSKIKSSVLVQIGSDDKHIYQNNTQDCINYLMRAFKNAKVSGQIIKGASHCYNGFEAELGKNVANWLR